MIKSFTVEKIKGGLERLPPCNSGIGVAQKFLNKDPIENDKEYSWKNATVSLMGEKIEITPISFSLTHKERRQMNRAIPKYKLSKIRIPRNLKKYIKARTNIKQSPTSTLIALYNLGWRSDKKIKLGKMALNS